MKSGDGEFVGLWQLSHRYIAHFRRVSVCRGSSGVAGGGRSGHEPVSAEDLVQDLRRIPCFQGN